MLFTFYYLNAIFEISWRPTHEMKLSSKLATHWKVETHARKRPFKGFHQFTLEQSQKLSSKWGVAREKERGQQNPCHLITFDKQQVPGDPIFYSGILRRFLTAKVLQSPSFGKKGKMSFFLKSSICKYAHVPTSYYYLLQWIVKKSQQFLAK